jgi:hypothetical protein
MVDGKVDAPQGYDRFLWTAWGEFFDGKKGDASHLKEKTILRDSAPVDWAVIGKHLPGKHDQQSHGHGGRPGKVGGSSSITELGEGAAHEAAPIESETVEEGFILDDSSIATPPYGDEVVKEVWGDIIVEKHLSGKHDQSTHGRKRGGSGPGAPAKSPKSKFPDKAEDVTPEMRMKQATSKDIEAQMKKNLREIGGGAPKLNTVEGKLDKANVDKIIDNMKKELGTYSSYLAGDTNNRMRDYIDHDSL